MVFLWFYDWFHKTPKHQLEISPGAPGSPEVRGPGRKDLPEAPGESSQRFVFQAMKKSPTKNSMGMWFKAIAKR